MTHKLKTETFSQKIERSDGVIVLRLTPLVSFVTCYLKCFLHGIFTLSRQLLGVVQIKNGPKFTAI